MKHGVCGLDSLAGTLAVAHGVRIAFARTFVDGTGGFVTKMTFVPGRGQAHGSGMKPHPSRPEDVCRLDPDSANLRRQGRAVLTALGEHRLAREFVRRSLMLTDHEALSRLLLECLLRRRPR